MVQFYMLQGGSHLESKSAQRLVLLKLLILLVNILICEKLGMGRFWALVTMVLIFTRRIAIRMQQEGKGWIELD